MYHEITSGIPAMHWRVVTNHRTLYVTPCSLPTLIGTLTMRGIDSDEVRSISQYNPPDVISPDCEFTIDPRR